MCFDFGFIVSFLQLNIAALLSEFIVIAPLL